MSEDLKKRRALANALLEAAMGHRFNEELIIQVAALNAKIRVLEDRLRGNNTIRSVAARAGVPQSVVIDVLYTCVEERLDREKELRNE